MLTKTTHSSNFLFQICMEWNAEDIFEVFRENAVRAKEIALWRYKDVVLDVKLFVTIRALFVHYSCSDLGFCLSLNCSV